MRCLLDIGSLTVPIDIPSRSLRECELTSLREIYLRIPGEKPQPPDLTKIFPAGAERAAKPVAALPDSPGQVARPVTAPAA